MSKPHRDRERAGIRWQISQVVVAGIPIAVQVINDPVTIDVNGERNIGGQVRILSVGWGGKGIAAVKPGETVEIQSPAGAFAAVVGVKVQPRTPSVDERIDFAPITISGCVTRIGLVSTDTGLDATGMDREKCDADGGFADALAGWRSEANERAECQGNRHGCHHWRRRPVGLS